MPVKMREKYRFINAIPEYMLKDDRFLAVYSGWRKIESSLFCILKNALLRLRSWKGGFTTGAENGLIFFISFMKDCMPTTRIRRLRAVKKSRTGIKIICLFC